VEKQAIDWASLNFTYIPTAWRYISVHRGDQWDEGHLSDNPNVEISECAGALQYAQTCFEGLKVYTTVDNKIVAFRPDLNAQRMHETAQRLVMPPFPTDRFLTALDEVVVANKAFVPPFGSGASLYVRPYLFGSGPVIGVAPSPEYTFRIFTSPVGPYFKGGVRPLKLFVSDYDRAAPNGTGHIKAGLNYAMSLYAGLEAKRNGYDENMYLDSKTRTFIEETGGANFIFVTKDKKVVTPKSPTILPSITRRSLVHVAQEYLGLEVEEREVELGELADFAEGGLCGTAAVISPIGSVTTKDGEVALPSGMKTMGPITQQLYNTLTAIQYGTIEAPKGWIRVIA